MVPPERLIGLSRRRRRPTPKPEAPVGYMWGKKGLESIADIELHCRLQMNWYDSQPQYIRQLIQEHGLGIIKQRRQLLSSDMMHIPSQPDTLYMGVDYGREPSHTIYTAIKWRSN